MLMMNCGKFAFTGLRDSPVSSHQTTRHTLRQLIESKTLKRIWTITRSYVDDELGQICIYRPYCPHQSIGHPQCQPLKGHFEGRGPLLRDIGTVYQVTPSI